MSTINLRDYGRTAAQRGWGAGWPSCGGAKAAGTAIVTADTSGTRMSVHKRIARLVDLLIDATERSGYRLMAGQCGGYNCRPIGGTRSPSNHSWGLAVDLNWQRNPMKRPLTTDMPDWMVRLWNRYGFAWGGHYSGTPDAMHFEFMGTPEQADAMTALAQRELVGNVIPPRAPAAPAAPAPGTSRPTIRRGSTGPAVALIQRFLGLRDDGKFGDQTHAAVLRYQRMKGLAVDGIVGAGTWRATGL
ncbi:M15 family metallopeptidase [Pseudonocardia alni]|uniref:M15 family metallopeptidase n=1 Tax=Pseudonocardia alni TaxID=33907 RepID=UPI0027A82849|nr:hypothetical protein PaSha_13970 [Pseudonocardia alni]WFG47444.1 hypothetical protein PaSha_28595 [Pseudonocardia alni]